MTGSSCRCLQLVCILIYLSLLSRFCEICYFSVIVFCSCLDQAEMFSISEMIFHYLSDYEYDERDVGFTPEDLIFFFNFFFALKDLRNLVDILDRVFVFFLTKGFR